MTLPPVVRVFFALEPSPLVRDSVGRCLEEIKKRAKNHAIRWARHENLHITLQFIGEVQREHLDRLTDSVKNSLLGKTKPLTVHLGELCLFPSAYRPRVVVMGVPAQEALAELAKWIGEGITHAGYEVEKRPFRAHMTLGRIKQPKGVDYRFLSAISLPQVPPLKVNEIVLFRSEPHPEGSHYTALSRIPLYVPTA